MIFFNFIICFFNYQHCFYLSNTIHPTQLDSIYNWLLEAGLLLHFPRRGGIGHIGPYVGVAPMKIDFTMVTATQPLLIGGSFSTMFMF